MLLNQILFRENHTRFFLNKIAIIFYVFILLLSCNEINGQGYTSDELTEKKNNEEISQAKALIEAKSDDSYQNGIDLFSKIEEKIIVSKDTLLLLDFYKTRIDVYLSNYDYESA
jgi:hypothetical protein